MEIDYEKRTVLDWIGHHFGERWASECDVVKIENSDSGAYSLEFIE